MTDPTHDLSKLKIRRDEPSPSARRALRTAAWIAGFAVVFVVVVLVVVRGTGGVQVTVGLAQVVGGQSGSSLGITANGYVVARTKASVASRISGRLVYLGVEEGSVVTQGDTIASLENADYKAVVAQTEAEVMRAEAVLQEAVAQRDQLIRDVRRARDLLSDSLISEQEVEDVSARLDAAEARVAAQAAQVRASLAAVGVAQANLENTYIRAPFDGTVLRKDAEVGEVVAPVATGGGLTRGAVVTMADLETLEVEVDVNEAYIAQRGEVRQIVPTADRQRATVLVKISILDRDPRILPEMGTRVDFMQAPDAVAAEPEASRVFVPSSAVRDEQGQPVVWVVREGRVFRTVVTAGPVSGGRREIRSGLSGGEQVVIAGPAVLEDGAAVRVVVQ
jgi:RND family efflux transporter MFP subunit